MAVMVNEICMTFPEDQECTSSYIELLKSACSLSTVFLVAFMIWQISVIYKRNWAKTYLASKNIRWRQKDRPHSNTSAASPSLYTLSALSWKNLSRILNLLVNCVHTMPYVTFSVPAQMLGMTVNYRIEALMGVQPRFALLFEQC